MQRLIPEYDTVEPMFREYYLTRDDKLRSQLVEWHEGLPFRLARRFSRNDEDLLEDLHQEGVIGLIEAVEKFEPNRGNKFSTYATTIVVGHITHYLRDKGRVIRVSHTLQELNSRAMKVSDQLALTLGREPSLGEVAEAVGCDEDDLVAAIEAVKTGYVTSLDENLSDTEGSDSRLDFVGGIDQDIELIGEYDDLEIAMSLLGERERAVVRQRFFDGLTQYEVAANLGLSPGYICTMAKRSLRKLKNALNSDSCLLRTITQKIEDEKPNKEALGSFKVVPQFKGESRPYPITQRQLMVLLEFWPTGSFVCPKPIYRNGLLASWKDSLLHQAVWGLCGRRGPLVRAGQGCYLKGNPVVRFKGSGGNLTIGGATFVKGGVYCLDEVSQFQKANGWSPSGTPKAIPCGNTKSVTIGLAELRVALTVYGLLSDKEPKAIFRPSVANLLGISRHTVDKTILRLADKGIIVRSTIGKFLRGHSGIEYVSQFKTVFVGGLCFESGNAYNLAILARGKTLELPELTEVHIRTAVMAYSLIPEEERGPISGDLLAKALRVKRKRVLIYCRDLEKLGILQGHTTGNWWARGELDRFVAILPSNGAMFFKTVKMRRGGIYSLRQLSEIFAKTGEGKAFIANARSSVKSESGQAIDCQEIFDLNASELAAVLAFCLQMPGRGPHAITPPKSVDFILKDMHRHPSLIISCYLRSSSRPIMGRQGRSVYLRLGDYVRLRKSTYGNRFVIPIEVGKTYALDDLLQQLRSALSEKSVSVNTEKQATF